jgi:chromosome segregation ATPase
VASNNNADYDRTPTIIRQLSELEPGQRISLTRRVFRDGSGGYFINDHPVRLKDVDAVHRYNLGRSAVCDQPGQKWRRRSSKRPRNA